MEKGPTHQKAARKKKSGRSGPFAAQDKRDDNCEADGEGGARREVSGPPPSYGGQAEGGPYKDRRDPRAKRRELAALERKSPPLQTKGGAPSSTFGSLRSSENPRA